jgi:hypothetical protein
MILDFGRDLKVNSRDIEIYSYVENYPKLLEYKWPRISVAWKLHMVVTSYLVHKIRAIYVPLH